MGVSTDGQLSYGIVFEEGFEFPWDYPDFDGDMDEWWMFVNGFENPIESPYTSDGQGYREGFNENSPEIPEYFKNRRNWMESNPLPVELVNYCSLEYPIYLLATKHYCASRGYPEEIDPRILLDTTEPKERLKKFVNQYGIQTDCEPRWWLTSFWEQ